MTRSYVLSSTLRFLWKDWQKLEVTPSFVQEVDCDKIYFVPKIIKYKIIPKYLRLKELGSWYICFRSTWTLNINITQEMFGILEHFAALTPKFNHRWNFRSILCYDLFSHFGLRRMVLNCQVQVNTFNHYHFDFDNVFGIYRININRLILYIFEQFIPINLMLKKNLSIRLLPIL